MAISSEPLKSTAQELGVADPVKLGQAVRATANDTTRILTIRAQDSDPEKAARIANTLAEELIHLTTGATTRPEGQLEIIGEAIAPLTPIAPQVSLIVLLAMVAGLLGGLILVIVVEYATDTVRDRADLARLSGSDVLATLAFDPRVPRSTRSRSRRRPRRTRRTRSRSASWPRRWPSPRPIVRPGRSWSPA